MKTLKRFVISILLVLPASNIRAQQGYTTASNIGYYEKAPDRYASERCVLDVYHPENGTDSDVVVWFHGGGLTVGGKHIPEELRGQGLCVVAVNYRLSPKAHNPAYTEDAAAAVAWTCANISKYGGDPGKITVAGHSAGGYLALMLALDKSWLAKYGIDAAALKGYFPVSGQCATHNTIRGEMGLDETIPYIDRYAPLHHITADTAPITLVCGQADLEFVQRTAENYFLYQALLGKGNTVVKYHSLSGFDHVTCMSPALQLLVGDLKKQ